MKSVQFIDYVVVVLYMLLMLGVGVYFMRFNRNVADFFKGGNRIPWLVSGVSAFMTGFSTWTFTGAAGIAYNDGIIIVLLYVGNACTFLFGYWLFAVRWRRARISSPMEFLSERFNGTTRQVFSWSTVLFDLFMVAVWLVALGQFMSATLQVPVNVVILGSAAIILLYCLFGGVWAVVVTDFIQGVILVPFTIVLAVAALIKLGGVSNFAAALPKEMLQIGHSEYSSWLYFVSWTTMVVFGYNTRAHAQRYYSVDTEASAKKIAALNFVLFLLGAFIWFIPPLAARALYPDIAQVWPGSKNPQEGAYAIMSLTLLPHGLIGVMIAAMFSASMSNVSGFYNLFAAIITHDILPQWSTKFLDGDKALWAGRMATLAVGLVVPVIALLMVATGESTFSLMLIFNSIISIAYGPAALIGLLSKSAPQWSGLVYFTVALLMGSVGWFFFGWGLEENVIYVVPLSGVIMLGLPRLLGSAWADGAEPRRRRELFFEKLATPINVAEELGKGKEVESAVFGFLGKVTLAMGLFSLVFLVLEKSEAEGVIIVVYSILTVILGVGFLFLGRRHTEEGK